MALLAYKTSVTVLRLLVKQGEREGQRAKAALFPWHATRARLAFASVGLKYAKKKLCSAGYGTPAVIFK